ncbi:MAG: helix-turn-helix domain-containing protein [Mycobacteriaceae bacterium]|nr:helix-turn-helix domain-containing protein [Mycobacteriaceae bacterium]
MTTAGHDEGADVGRHIAETAERIHKRLAEASTFIRRSLEEDIPELRSDPRLVELLDASVEANVETLLHALRYDIAVQRIEAPMAAVEYARRLAQHDVPVNALVRAYRLGQSRMNELVFREVRGLDVAATTRFAVLEAISAILFEYIDRISQQVVVVYEDERERWLENQSSIRVLRVREVLEGRKAVDVDATSNSIRYPLRWHHLAVVMWYPQAGARGDELARVQRFLRELGQATAVGSNPLFVATDQIGGLGWLPYRSSPADAVDAVRQFARKRPDSPSVAIGSVAPGLEGFRRSHREAEAAHAVAVAGGQQEAAVVAASDPGLLAAALLGGDIDAARDWVGVVLGDLAADNDNDARLRETLRVFLRCGCSYKQAADELDLHFNTVKYRVGRAVARRGQPIDGDRLDVELALLACQWYGTAVLQPDRT